MAKRTANERDGTDSELQPDYDGAVFRDDEFDVNKASRASPNAKIHGMLTQILYGPDFLKHNTGVLVASKSARFQRTRASKPNTLMDPFPSLSTTEETESYKSSRHDWEEWIGSETNLCILFIDDQKLGLGGIPVLVTIFGIMSKPVARYHQNFDTGISIIRYYRKNTVLQSKIDGHCTIILINAHLTKLLPTLYCLDNEHMAARSL